MKSKRRVKITYRGWAGHFCMGHRCLFHLHTLLECGEERVVVSTVGNLRNSEVRNGEGRTIQTIGLDRCYETMAFRAVWEEPYWEADVSNELSFDSPWAIEDAKCDSDLRANKMHEAVVEEFRQKMERSASRDH